MHIKRQKLCGGTTIPWLYLKDDDTPPPGSMRPRSALSRVRAIHAGHTEHGAPFGPHGDDPSWVARARPASAPLIKQWWRCQGCFTQSCIQISWSLPRGDHYFGCTKLASIQQLSDIDERCKGAREKHRFTRPFASPKVVKKSCLCHFGLVRLGQSKFYIVVWELLLEIDINIDWWHE